jgi:N4-gp56 family major capsid protein
MERMKDYHNERAWIPVEKYSQAGMMARGEEGTAGKFRFIVVPEMMHWAGAGAAVTANEGFMETDGNYDVFPLLAIGEKSFTTIGFQTDGKTVKFSIKHVKPESDVSYGHHDPFGEKGFMSIKWYYGFMPLRPERIALIKSVARI